MLINNEYYVKSEKRPVAGTECPPPLPPSKEEILKQPNRLLNHKTPGVDGIQGEVLKAWI